MMHGEGKGRGQGYLPSTSSMGKGRVGDREYACHMMHGEGNIWGGIFACHLMHGEGKNKGTWSVPAT